MPEARDRVDLPVNHPPADRSAGAGMTGGMRSGGAPDFQQMLSRMPTVALADLHKGDAVMIVATQGTAIRGSYGDYLTERRGGHSASGSQRKPGDDVVALEFGRARRWRCTWSISLASIRKPPTESSLVASAEIFVRELDGNES